METAPGASAWVQAHAMDNPEAELHFKNDLQQWADTESQYFFRTSAGQDVEVAWLVLAQGINGLAKARTHGKLCTENHGW